MWFLRKFDRSIALRFMEEIERSSITIAHATRYKLGFPIRGKESWSGFLPRGFVIHPTRTKSIDAAIGAQTNHEHKTHFIVTAMKLDSGDGLLGEIPASIIMVHNWDVPISHSGWMSGLTWGIELRNVGRLRPFKRDKEPPPLLPQEETYERFHEHETFGLNPPLYWLKDHWRTEWSGPAINWDGSYFEQVGENQLITLLALVRALSVLSGEMNGQYIMPSHLVSGGPPPMQGLEWGYLRDATTCYANGNPHEGIDAVFKKDEGFQLYTSLGWTGTKPNELPRSVWDERLGSNDDDIEAFELAPRNVWRHEREMGQLSKWNILRDLALDRNMGGRLRGYGFDTSSPFRILQTHGIAHQLEDATDEVLASHLLMTLNRDGFPKSR